MNCQDLTRILDDGDIARLTAAERASVEMHLSACPDCAEDWRIHQRLAARAVPAVPPDLVARCRQLVAGGKGRRAIGRAILFGSVLVFGAAAAMLSDWLASPPAADTAPIAVVAPAAPAATAAPAMVVQPVEALPSAAAMSAAQPGPRVATQPTATPQPTGFTVRLLSLDATGADAGQKAVLERFYNAFVQKLRTVPGLVLLTPESSGHEGAADFEIAILHQATAGVSPVGRQAVNIRSRSFMPQSPSSSSMVLSLDPRQDSRPEASAESVVENLRSRLFPPDVSLQQEKLARLEDRRLDVSQRQNAMNDLLQRYIMSSATVDPAVIRAAVDLATTAADPATRESVWRSLRNLQRRTAGADLIAPAARALGDEADENVRLELVTILAADRSGNAAARAALESVAQSDPRQLVRMAAQRALTGDAGWNEYVLATLKNADLTATQRLEPLAYMSSAGLSAAQLLLDDAAVRMLGDLLTNMDEYSPGASAALNALANARSPAARDVMMDMLRPGDGRAPAAPGLRGSVVGVLARSFPEDARARALVEEIAASDTDPSLRERARQAQNMADPKKMMQELLQQQQLQMRDQR